MGMNEITYLRCCHSNPDQKTKLFRAAKNQIAVAMDECLKCYAPKDECKPFLQLFREFLELYDELIKGRGPRGEPGQRR